MSGPAPPPSDAGLQNERTTLAWVRSSLAFVAVGMLLADQVPTVAASIAVLAGVLVVAATMVTMAERRHHERTGRAGTGTSVVTVPAIALTSGAVLALAALGLLVVAV